MKFLKNCLRLFQYKSQQASIFDAKVDENMSHTLTPAEVQALSHWSTFGQPGEPPAERVTAGDWNSKPFIQVVKSKWELAIPRDQVYKVLLGFRPQEMEDKWFVYTTGPDVEGRATIHMIRSWTGFRIAQVALEGLEVGEKEGMGKGPRITGFLWEASTEVMRDPTEEGSRETIREVLRWVLGVQFPTE